MSLAFFREWNCLPRFICFCKWLFSRPSWREGCEPLASSMTYLRSVLFSHLAWALPPLSCLLAPYNSLYDSMYLFFYLTIHTLTHTHAHTTLSGQSTANNNTRTLSSTPRIIFLLICCLSHSLYLLSILLSLSLYLLSILLSLSLSHSLAPSL